MKTFYLTTALLVCAFAATAQTEKGTLNINGLFGSNGGGVYQSNDASNRFKLNLGANVGYFVKSNWEIGAGVQIMVSSPRVLRVMSTTVVAQGWPGSHQRK